MSCVYLIEYNFNCDWNNAEKLYGNVDSIDERHRHRYEVNPSYVAQLEEKGLMFVGHDSEKVRMEVVELGSHPYYVGVQFHPEYLSRPLKPSPPFMGLILASKKKLITYLDTGSKKTQNGDVTTSDYEESSGMYRRVWNAILNCFLTFCISVHTNTDDDYAKIKKMEKKLKNVDLAGNDDIPNGVSGSSSNDERDK